MFLNIEKKFFRTIICIFSLTFIATTSVKFENTSILRRDSWKPIDTNCEAFVNQFAEAAANFTQCATENSIPPRVCLRCADAFAHVRIAYWALKDDQQKSTEGDTCSSEVFDFYELSHVSNVYDDLQTNIWGASRCDTCLAYTINPAKQHSHFMEFNNRTNEFLQIHHQFKTCVNDYVINATTINSSVCDGCWTQYSKVNAFYDEVFYHKDKDLEFCFDVESMMNDTVKWWRDERKCSKPEYPTKSKDNLGVGLLTGFIFLCCVIFYGLAVLMGTRRKRTLKKYHRVGTGYSSIVVNSNEQLHRPERANLIRETNRPRRVISFSVLPPSGLG